MEGGVALSSTLGDDTAGGGCGTTAGHHDFCLGGDDLVPAVGDEGEADEEEGGEVHVAQEGNWPQTILSSHRV